MEQALHSAQGWGKAEIITYNLDVTSIAFGSINFLSDGMGNAFVVWFDDRGIWYNQYHHEAGWDEASLFYESSVISEIDLAMSNNSRVVLFKENESVRFLQHDDASGWRVTETFNTSALPVRQPKIAIDDTGNIIALWRQYDNEKTTLVSTEFTQGVGWSEPHVIADSAEHNHSADVSFLDQGNAFVAYVGSTYDRNTGNYEESVQTLSYSVNYGWSNTETVAEMSHYFYTWGELELAFSEKGDILIAWHQQLTNNWNAYNAVTYSQATGWSEYERIGVNADGGLGAVRMNAAGDGVVIWAGLIDSIEVNRYIPGLGWQGEERLTDTYTDNFRQPDAAIAPSGQVMSIWSYPTTDPNVFAGIYVP